jgi:fumarate reductase subunit C
VLKYYDLFRTSAMRLSNAWRKFRLAAPYAFGIFAVLFCVYQLYCAVAYGTVEGAWRGHNDWITFRTNPGFFVFSLSMYGFIVAIAIAVFCAWAFGPQQAGRWRSRQEIGEAIRLDPDSR